MNKIKTVILIAIAIVLFASCSKQDQEFCWECQPTVKTFTPAFSYTIIAPYPDTGVITIHKPAKTKTVNGEVSIVCGATEQQIRDIEQQAQYKIDNVTGTTSCIKTSN